MGCGSSQEDDASARDTREERNDEEVLEGKINYTVGDKKFIEMKKWPIILQDTTGSMTMGTTAMNATARCDTVREVVRIISTKLARIDNADRQDPLQKGVPIVTFNDDEGGQYRGFIHPATIDKEWAAFEFGGRTHIMRGWHEVIARYKRQFEDQPENAWPVLLVMLITDGELCDGEEFERHLKKVHGRAFVEIALIGYGEDHDRAQAHYQRIAAANPHIRMTRFDKVADADLIASQLISMLDPTLFIARGAPAPVAPYAPQLVYAPQVAPLMQPTPMYATSSGGLSSSCAAVFSIDQSAAAPPGYTV